MSKVGSEYEDLDKYQYSSGNIYYYKKCTYIRHNPYGPAVIFSDSNIVYFINNEFLTKEKFEVHPERLKFLGKEYLICLG